MAGKFEILKKLIVDAENYHSEGEHEISRSLLDSISSYAKKMSEKPKEITGFKNEIT